MSDEKTRAETFRDILTGQWSDERQAEVEAKFGKRIVIETTPTEHDDSYAKSLFEAPQQVEPDSVVSWERDQ